MLWKNVKGITIVTIMFNLLNIFHFYDRVLRHSCYMSCYEYGHAIWPCGIIINERKTLFYGMTQWITVYCISAWRCLEKVCMWTRGRRERVRQCLSPLMKMNWVIHWIAGLINSVCYLTQRRQVLSDIHTHIFMGCVWCSNKSEPNRLACRQDYILQFVLFQFRIGWIYCESGKC